MEWRKDGCVSGSSWSLRGDQRRRPSDGRHWGNYRVWYLFSVLMQGFGHGFVKTHRITGGFNRRRLGAELKSGGAKALFQVEASDRSRQVAGTVSQGMCAAREVDHSKRVCGTASERVEHLREAPVVPQAANNLQCFPQEDSG